MEHWLPIEEFPGYEVSDQGRVRNENTGRLLGIYDNGHGVLQVVMRRAGRNTARAVHKLVAEAFIHPGPEDAVPIHLDGDWANNAAYNLEWRPRWFAKKRTLELRRPRPLDPRPVRRMSTGEIYENVREAARAVGSLEELILQAAMWGGPGHSVRGSNWEFYNGN